MLVAYSMLQMVRQQVLQESMTGDDILLVRASSGKAQSSPTGSRRPLTRRTLRLLPGPRRWSPVRAAQGSYGLLGCVVGE